MRKIGSYRHAQNTPGSPHREPDKKDFFSLDLTEVLWYNIGGCERAILAPFFVVTEKVSACGAESGSRAVFNRSSWWDLEGRGFSD